jgi:Family of unknown function (DUF6191)
VKVIRKDIVSTYAGLPGILGLVSVFFELFNAGGRHQTEESRRLENTREEEGQSEPGRGPIDLTSGTVFIKPRAKPAGPESDSESGPADAPEDQPS